MKIAVQCEHCGSDVLMERGAVNRARCKGNRLFCGRRCAGYARRKNKSKAQRIAEKAAYDAEYRIKNRDMLRAKKADYFQRTYDPAKAALDRKARMPRHIEYCRQPEYRAYKKSYDRKYRAQKFYGAFSDCFLLVMDIRDECLRQISDYEIRVSKGTINKRQQRKRDYERSLRTESEIGPMGNLELGQGWQNGGLAGGLRSIAGPRNSSHDEYPASRLAAGKASSSGGRNYIRGDIDSAILKSRLATNGGGAE